MPTWTTVSLFLLSALGLLFIPGPSVLFIITRSVDCGRQVGAISSLGIGAADLIHTTAAAFGLSALLMTSALAFSIVKYLGAVYLISLGIRTLLKKDGAPREKRREPKTLPRMFFQGMTVELLNPKRLCSFSPFYLNLLIPLAERSRCNFSSSEACTRFLVSVV